MKNEQLDLLGKIEEVKKVETPYRNGLGELLPWEEPEYLEKLAKYEKSIN